MGTAGMKAAHGRFCVPFSSLEQQEKGTVGKLALRRAFAVGFVLLGVIVVAHAEAGSMVGIGIHKLSLHPTAEMTRADLYTLDEVTNPRAVLVLCPGFNDNGEALICQPTWQEFARTNRLVLCGVSFASTDQEVQAIRGYFHAERGSGDLLLNGLRLAFGRDLPILIYGFSGGARFAASVVGWKPARVLSWCAYSTCWWEEPQALSNATPPGIVACGEEDASNYGSSTTFFAKGRAAGLRWTWLSLANTGHSWSEPLNHFVRAYFAAILDQAFAPTGHQIDAKTAAGHLTGVWQDVDTKEVLSAAQASIQPTLATWLPSVSLGVMWSRLHTP